MISVKSFRDLLEAAPDELKQHYWKNWKAPQNVKHHPEGNVAKHILQVTRRAFVKFPDNINIILAAFFHDLGKIDTLAYSETGNPTAHGHEKVSAELVTKFAPWIIEMGGDPEEVYFIVYNHMRIKPDVWSVMKKSKKDKLTTHKDWEDLESFGTIDKGGLSEEYEYDEYDNTHRPQEHPISYYKTFMKLVDENDDTYEGRCINVLHKDEFAIVTENCTLYIDLAYFEQLVNKVDQFVEAKKISSKFFPDRLSNVKKQITEMIKVKPYLEEWEKSQKLNSTNMKTSLFDSVTFDDVEFDDSTLYIKEGVEEDFNPTFAPEMAGQLIDKSKMERFLFAGKAIFTIRNNDTGNRFTYRVLRPKRITDDVYFVSVLTGSDNNSSYTFFGTIFDKTTFKISKKTKIGMDSMSIKAFMWFWKTLLSNQPFPPQVQIWHEGLCGKCGKKLTVPESVDIGLGPVCAKTADLWERSPKLVKANSKIGIFERVSSFKVFEAQQEPKQEAPKTKEKFKQLEKDWQQIYKTNKKIVAQLKKVKKTETTSDIEFKQLLKQTLQQFNVSNLKITSDGSYHIVKFNIANDKFEFEFYKKNGKLVEDFEGQQKTNESTQYDSMLLGKKIIEIKDYIKSFELEPSRFIDDKVIVACDEYPTYDEAIKNLRNAGYSIGKMQGNAPIGFTVKPYTIEKWRNLKEDRAKLDGIIVEMDGQCYVLYFTFPEL